MKIRLLGLFIIVLHTGVSGADEFAGLTTPAKKPDLLPSTTQTSEKKNTSSSTSSSPHSQASQNRMSQSNQPNFLHLIINSGWSRDQIRPTRQIIQAIQSPQARRQNQSPDRSSTASPSSTPPSRQRANQDTIDDTTTDTTGSHPTQKPEESPSAEKPTPEPFFIFKDSTLASSKNVPQFFGLTASGLNTASALGQLATSGAQIDSLTKDAPHQILNKPAFSITMKSLQSIVRGITPIVLALNAKKEHQVMALCMAVLSLAANASNLIYTSTTAETMNLSDEQLHAFRLGLKASQNRVKNFMIQQATCIGMSTACDLIRSGLEFDSWRKAQRILPDEAPLSSLWRLYALTALSITVDLFEICAIRFPQVKWVQDMISTGMQIQKIDHHLS